MIATLFVWIVLALLAALVLLWWLPGLRRALLTGWLFGIYRKMLPQMSDTERAALEAGTVWWEGELFRGNPDWRKWFSHPVPTLTAEEQAFLDHECREACRLSDEWQSTHALGDLSPEAWRYIKEKGFLGMIIPKAYGGLQFSAFAHSQIITRLSTRSSALAVSVMVPNSLGPAELLLHYGTEEQKSHYLPRLAKGEEIPAFALTSPWAGSDAAAIPDYGVVCKGQWQGREVVGMRVTWHKRYITLAPVCTVLGLAFRLHDPEGLLGGGKDRDVGITCALIPRDHPGVEIGRRHLPLNAVFMNGPTRGRDVFMPLDFIIGGAAMAGQGWRMLMECLAAGRAISLPSSNTGMAQLTTRTVTGYARIRSQFKTPIGKFEGVEEALARIGGNTYLMDAVRKLTASAVDLGEKPSVVSAIAKYHVTERARVVVNDGMDVIGGKGICLGPSNFLGRAYQQIPIGITVEGANILTRSLIIFGQGAIRCHPWLLAEMHAAQDADRARGLRDFDRALTAHVAYTACNLWRTVARAFTGGRMTAVPVNVDDGMRRYYQDISRMSAAYALVADVSLLLLGGEVKRREKLSARLGDILSQLYLMSCTLKRFELEGRQTEDAPLAHWALQDALHRLQLAFDGVLDNFPSAVLGALLRRLIFPWGRAFAAPSDALGQRVVRALLGPTAARARLTAECYVPLETDAQTLAAEPVAAIEQALRATLKAEPIEAKIRAAERTGRLDHDPRANVRDMPEAAQAAGIINAEEYAVLQARDELRDLVVHVDDFPFDILPPGAVAALPGGRA